MKSVALKLFKILSFKEKQKLVVLLFVLLFAAGIEMLGIGLLIPVLAMLADIESFLNNNYIIYFSNILGNLDKSTIIKLLLVSVIFVFIIKNIGLYFIRYYQFLTVYGICHTLRTRLIKLYLCQEWKFHMQVNSAIILRNITHELQRVSSLIDTFITLIAELLIIFGFVTLIILFMPSESILMILLMGITVLLFSKILPKMMEKMGRERTEIDGILIQSIKEIFGAIKEIILIGRGREFHKILTKISKQESKLHAKLLNIQNVPGLVTETIIVSFILGIIFVISDIENLSGVIPTIGIIAVTGIRLKPSFTKVLNALNTINFQKDALDVLHQDFLLLNAGSVNTEPTNENLIRFAEYISIDEITYSYPKSSLKVVRNISFQFKKGESIGIIGKSGSGKTTLVDLFLGLLKPEKGKIRVDDIDINNNLRGWQDKIGYVPQSIYLTDDTIKRNIALGISDTQINEKAIINAISSAQMVDFINSLPEGLDTIVGEYGVRFSGGQRQRIGIARALYHNPEILVFDEATSSVDNVTEKKLMKSIEALSKEKTIIIVAHRLDTVKNCDKIIMLDNGEIVAKGTWNELSKKSETFHSYVK